MRELDPDNMPILQRYFFHELKDGGFDNFRYIGDGAYKRAYSATRNGLKYAVKVMGSERGKNESNLQTKILDICGKSIPTFIATNDYYESTLNIDDIIIHFVKHYADKIEEENERYKDVYLYLLDVKRYNVVPFVYEVSDLYDITLDNYFSKEKWSWTNYKNIFCQILHGLQYLQSKTISFTDFKLNNVMIDKKTLQIYFIDYFNSPYECDFVSCDQDDNVNFTYYHVFYKKINFHQDIFRIGVAMLNAIEIRNHGQWKPSKDIGDIVSETYYEEKHCKKWLFLFDDCDNTSGKKEFLDSMKQYLENFKSHLQHSKQLSSSDKINLYSLIERVLFIDPNKPFPISKILQNSFFSKCKVN